MATTMATTPVNTLVAINGRDGDDRDGDDDFAPLGSAGRSVLAALRADESSPDADLYRRLLSSAPGSHAYTSVVVTGGGGAEDGLFATAIMGASPNDGGVDSPGPLRSPGGGAPSPRGRGSSVSPLRRRTSSSSFGDAETASRASSAPSSSIAHTRSVPIPPLLAASASSVRVSSLMGLLPEAGLAWISVDERLHVWAYERSGSDGDVSGGELGSPGNRGVGTSQDFCTFTVPSKRNVVSVGLVRPKRGVFKSIVEWCLVVTTDDEVMLCAITKSTSPDEASLGGLRLVPTRYVISTDSVPMVKVCGTPDGRIFLGGYDGRLYEMSYEGLETTPPSRRGDDDDYYDGDVVTTPSSTSTRLFNGTKRLAKRALLPMGLLIGSNPSDGPRPRKCRKLDHSASAAPLVAAVLPSFVGQLLVAGIHGTGGPVIDLVADPERGTLYTLSEKGHLHAYNVENSDDGATAAAARVDAFLDLGKALRTYLDAVAQGRTHPPGNGRDCDFSGGSGAAAAGVGGKDGARALLRGRPESSRPRSLHVVRRKESTTLALCVVTGGGARAYLSRAATTGGRVALTLRHVRAPPSVRRTRRAVADGRSFAPGGDDDGRTTFPDVSAAFYRQGTMMLAWDGRSLPVAEEHHRSSNSDDAPRGDLLLAVAPDASAHAVREEVRDRDRNSRNGGADRIRMVVTDGLAETVSLPNPSGGGGSSNSNPTSRLLMGGRVWDISCPFSDASSFPPFLEDWDNDGEDLPASVTAPLLYERLFWASATPSDAELNIGIVPPYLPSYEVASRKKKNKRDSLGGRRSSTSEAIVPVNSMFSSAIELFTNIIRGTATMDVSSNYFADASSSSRQSNNLGKQWTSPNYKLVKRPSAVFYGATATSNRNRLAMESYRGGVSRSVQSTTGRKSLSSSSTPSARGPKASSAATGPTKPSNRTITLRSGLPSWSTNPAVAPLRDLAVHHLDSSHDAPPRRLLALNRGGVHVFERESVLQKLGSVLRRRRRQNDDGDELRAFFDAYGYREGCVMALTLAVSTSGNSLLAKRAVRAALAHASRPKLLALTDHRGRSNGSVNGTHHQHQGSVSTPTAARTSTPNSSNREKMMFSPGNSVFSSSSSSIHSSTVSLHGQEYEFVPSCIHDGLVTLTSRLLRPVWFKPAVVVTPSRVRTVRRPARVELLLDEATLDRVRRPLLSLQRLLRDVFDPAVSVVPGVRADGDVDMMDVENLDPSRWRQHQPRTDRRPTVAQVEARARLLEERSLHNLYRLVSRAVQSLSLLNLLSRAHRSPSLPEVEWGLLHGLTFERLVTSPAAQERVRSLLSSLVSSAPNDDTSFNSSGHDAEADRTASALESQAYLYFSAGDRLTFQGFRAVRSAHASPEGSARRIEFGNRAALLLRKAARHWKSPNLVCGRTGFQNDDDGSLPASSSSPVLKATNALMSIDHVGGVVDVCLVCASNFGGSVKGTSAENDPAESPLRMDTTSGALPWETGLYHDGSSGSKAVSAPPTSSRTVSPNVATPTRQSQQSPQSIVLSGVDVTTADARVSCYAILTHHLGQLLRSESDQRRGLVDVMMSVSTNSDDELFHNALYSYLLKENHVETLLRVQSRRLEKWLKEERKDLHLLWRYYVIHARHRTAAEVMYQRATTTAAVSIDERVECLARAVNSLKAAANDESRSDRQVTDDSTTEALRTAEELLEVAGLQKRVLSAVADRRADVNVDDLTNRLLTVSDLYNDYTAPLSLYELCLSIIKSCNSNEPTAIQTLWRSVLSRDVCSRTNDARTQTVLRRLRAGTPLADAEDGDEGGTFESGEWIPKVKGAVVIIGKDLYDGEGGNNCAFPLNFIVYELEELYEAYELVSGSAKGQEAAHNCNPDPWPIRCFEEIGVPYSSILEAYTERLSTAMQYGCDPSKRIRCLSSISDVLVRWVATATNRGVGRTGLSLDLPSPFVENDGNDSANQLARALSSGLSSQIDMWKGSLESLVGDHLGKTERVLAKFSDVESALDMF